MSTQVQWLTPSPLWPQLAPASDKTAFRAPALLRFASDTFMQDLQTLLAQNPAGLAGLVAQPETWRNPAVGLPGAPGSVSPASASGSNGSEPTTLKLFAPVHARFYLVTASLVCRLPALPDHTVKTNMGERTNFVLRKVLTNSQNPQGFDEYAWIPGANPPGWVLADPGAIAAGEDKLPLFNLQLGNNGTRRRMFAGVIPVGRKQAYVTGSALQKTNGTTAPATVDDPRQIEFQRQVLDPWADLVGWSGTPTDITTGPVAQITADSMAAAQGSAFILIDFANYLSAYLPLVWAAVQDASKASALSGEQLGLYQALSAQLGDIQDASRYSLAQALVLAKNNEDAFNNETFATGKTFPDLPSGYPGLLLTDLSDSNLANLIGRPGDPDQLTARPILTFISNALQQVGPPPASAVVPPVSNPQNPQGTDFYIVRCVYERPQCAVLTIPAVPVLSPPSQQFQMASHFDPDAPARKIQVALPIDTTAAALRKYDKGVSFMISDQLNQQMQRVTGTALKDLVNGTVNDGGGYGLGMICSFSIPIITICAMIVLFIFVILLNIVFFWMPFLKICFPIPTLKSKGS